MRKVYANLVSTIVLCFLLCGCVCYQFGNESKLPFKTIYVAPVCNDSVVPQMQAVLSTQIRQKLLQCLGVKLVSSS
ncbi:MAG: hypothetical protein LBB15_00175, partial [Puniceicoccales bacterium]|nr:hypothetical protein [Puniceicoccales bacterium]